MGCGCSRGIESTDTETEKLPRGGVLLVKYETVERKEASELAEDTNSRKPTVVTTIEGNKIELPERMGLQTSISGLFGKKKKEKRNHGRPVVVELAYKVRRSKININPFDYEDSDYRNNDFSVRIFEDDPEFRLLMKLEKARKTFREDEKEKSR